jgi:hypothetical protein
MGHFFNWQGFFKKKILDFKFEKEMILDVFSHQK